MRANPLRGRWPAVALAVAGTAVIAATLGGIWWRDAGSSRGPLGVVLITLDTTRADYLSIYGFQDAAMPHFERLAREGVVFEQASTVAPLTLPAHTSLFTGLFPPGHDVRDNADTPLGAGHTTLAEVLRDRGFRTAAFIGSAVLDPARGLAQGFDKYDAVPADDAGPMRGQRRADAVMTDAIAWLDTIGDARFFLWTHLYDAHRPYDPPDPHRSAHFNPYVGEIAFMDAEIGRLLATLEKRRLLDRTIVVVAGDHGESLGDHGERDHGIFVYETVLRVPLLIRAPRLEPARVSGVVRLVDVMPTVLDLLDITAPESDGVSLVDAAAGQIGTLEAYSESLYPERFGWSRLQALSDGRFKLIEAPRPELYDLRNDPFETTNIHAERRTVADAMAQRLATFARSRSKAPPAAGVAPLDAQQRERLAALGYVGSTSRLTPAPGTQLPDPKDCIGRFNAIGHPDNAAGGVRLPCR